MTIDYSIGDVAPYINWVYFYFAWQVKQKQEQQRLHNEAERFMEKIARTYRTHAIVEIMNACSDGDDIVLSANDDDDGETARIPCLRQQSGSPCLCLADFIAPRGSSSAPHHSNQIGVFAVSVDRGMECDFDSDPYTKMMAQLLADRLAEATAERLHEHVRKKLWGYVADEQLSIDEMLKEHFQGIRPAVGYPSLPDASVNFILDRLLDLSSIGITLTENGAMRPHASVSGLMLSHPDARYFNVGKIAGDQLRDYAQRRGVTEDTVRKFLAANIQ